VVPKTGCVIDGKICMSQRKIMKTVMALKNKNKKQKQKKPYISS